MNSQNNVRQAPWKLIVSVTLTAWIGASFYFCFTETGPYFWFVKQELRFIGSVYPEITWLSTFLAMMVPAAFLAALLYRLTASSSENPLVHPNQLSIQANSSQSTPVKKDLDWRDWVSGSRSRLIGFFIGPICIGMGMWFLIPSFFVGSLAYISVKDLEQGHPPPSHYLNLEGVALSESAIVLEKGSGSSSEVFIYVPINSDGKKSTPTTVFLKFTKNEEQTEFYQDLKTGHYQGTLSFRSLPAIVRQIAQSDGFILANNVYLMEYHNTPEADRNKGLWFLSVGLLASGIFFFWQRSKNKK